VLLDRTKSCLLVIDIQEKLITAINGADRVIANTAVLLRAAARLGIPALFSEQYPKGLGPTVPALAGFAAAGGPVVKSEFSCSEAPGFVERLRATGREQLVLAGIEAHVCVLQTALGFWARDYPVFVVADAVSSRKPESVAVALDRLRDEGVAIVTTEMVLFEWLGRAGTPEFKELSALIK
jgi:nicotinamidase-related amidase